MATMLAKTPLSKRPTPFVPVVDTSAAPLVAWMPVLVAADVVVSFPESVQKTGPGGQNVEPDVANPRRGRARTREVPKRLPSRTPSPSGCSVVLSEASTTAESWLKQEEPIADISTLSGPTDYVKELQEMDDLPVKNTFVHFNTEHLEDLSGAPVGGEVKKLSRSSSSPSIVLTCPFKRLTVTEMHDPGQCNPCAYLYNKADGCRLGSQCKYCHLCPADGLKIRKKQKLKELKARKAAMKD